ncbi:MAG: PP2C family protein-serine/threonine phosphatase [Terriglobales bacterium]
MRLPFQSSAPRRAFRRPSPSPIPELKAAQVAARYREARLGGDFFEFLPLPSGRLLLFLVDIAGKRETAMDVAAAVQDVLRKRAPELLDGDSAIESGHLGPAEDRLAALLLELNRTVMMSAGGVCCAPGFLAYYDPGFGTLAYINAGHVPALVKDATGITTLPANGLPLGLFSHAVHDTHMFVLQPGAALLLASRGVVEVRGGHPREEFGLERVKQTLAADCGSALEICSSVLDAVASFAESTPKLHIPIPGLRFNHDNGTNHHDPLASAANDTTVLALLRTK